MNYQLAPECERIASDLIDKYHQHLKHIKIAYMFKAKPAETAIEDEATTLKKRGRPRQKPKGGKVWIAKCSLVSGKYRLLFTDDYRFVITADQEIWDSLTLAQQTAVMDHELCHATLDEEGNPRLRKHDLEEFRAAVDRNGLYLADIQAFYEACKRGAEKKDAA